jgi:hypothetical protein
VYSSVVSVLAWPAILLTWMVLPPCNVAAAWRYPDHIMC